MAGPSQTDQQLAAAIDKLSDKVSVLGNDISSIKSSMKGAKFALQCIVPTLIALLLSAIGAWISQAASASRTQAILENQGKLLDEVRSNQMDLRGADEKKANAPSKGATNTGTEDEQYPIDDRYISSILKISETGSHKINTGDLVVISVPSDPSLGPGNPAEKIEIDVTGKCFSKNVFVGFLPPPRHRRIDDTTGELQAHLRAISAGKAVVHATPINGKGKPVVPIDLEFECRER